MALGALLVTGSAACFALAAVLARMGMRSRAGDDGLFMSALINVVVLALLLPFAGRAPWSWPAVGAFVLAGLLGTWLGRFAQLRAIRRIGAARSNAFMVSAPVFAALSGWLVLGEAVSVGQALGALVVAVGLVSLARSRATVPVLAPGGAAGDGTRVASADRRGGPEGGLWYALLAPVLFGQAFVARKWGLVHYPSAITGALVGATTSLAVVVTASSLFGELSRLIEDNIRRIPWLFVATGGAMTAALLLQFASYFFLPAWMVGVLAGTSAVWALLWSRVFLRTEEAISRRLVASVVLVLAGVCAMAVSS